jgi:hypothetical protein
MIQVGLGTAGVIERYYAKNVTEPPMNFPGKEI